MKILVWKARDDKGIVLRKLGQMTGIKKSTLNNIENGKKSPTMDEMEAIAKALNIKINDLYESENK